jgi:lysozyme
MTTRKTTDNEAFVKRVQAHLGVAPDGWAGAGTNRAWEAKYGLVIPDSSYSDLRASRRAIDLIHSMESFEAKAYPDPGSKNGLPVTIGWGSTSDLNGNPIKLGTVWSRETADAKFAQDLRKFETGVLKALDGALVTPNQFDAMVSLAYNIGVRAFTGSTVVRKHKAGDYAGAKAAFAMWNKNDGKVMNGLVRRRASEAEMYGS